MNFCLMAYGQTSAGKTYTLFGKMNTPEEGIVPRFSRKLFEKLAEIENAGVDNVRLTVSLFEIYKEKVFDLFAEETTSPLQLREDPVKGVYFENLSKNGFKGITEFLDSLYTAFMKRKVSETLVNERSSRSHLVITFDIEISSQLDCQEIQGSENKLFEITKKSKIIFIDLAGSERQSLNTAEVMQEGCHINRSLSILQHVITSISKRNSADFIHFRDSKLTHFLKEIFKGNSHFAILGNILTHQEYLKDTENTLNFVALAKRITTNPQINFETKEANKHFERKVIELLSKNLKATINDNQLQADFEKIITAVHGQSEKILDEFEKIQQVCSDSLKKERYDEFKIIIDQLDFNGFSGLQRIYTDLINQLSQDQKTKKIDFFAFKSLLVDLQNEIDNHFDSKKNKLLFKIENLVSLIGEKMVKGETSLAKPLDSFSKSSRFWNKNQRNRSVECNAINGESTVQPPMKIFKNQAKFLKTAELQINLSDIGNTSVLRNSQGFNQTQASFLGSFLNPFGLSNSKVPSAEMEKDIAQSIHSYFQNERMTIESEKKKLENERNIFEGFREKEIRSGFKKTRGNEVLNDKNKKSEFAKYINKEMDGFESPKIERQNMQEINEMNFEKQNEKSIKHKELDFDSIMKSFKKTQFREDKNSETLDGKVGLTKIHQSDKSRTDFEELKMGFTKTKQPEKMIFCSIPENDTSGSTLKVQTYNSLSKPKSRHQTDLNGNDSPQIVPVISNNVTPSSAVIIDEINNGHKKQVDLFNKRINNLERQLRNRNKDYLFALKELEKIKLITSRREGSIDAGKKLIS